MGNKKRSRSHNKRKGPQLSEGERLWKRLNSLFGNNPQYWNKEWDLQSLADFIIEKEKMAIRFARDSKLERVFRGELSQTLAAIRKDRQYFTVLDNRKIILRSREVIEEIKINIQKWQSFFSKYTGHISGITAGPPILDAGDDEEIYNLIESSWLAILRGEKMPIDLTLLKDDDLQVWGNFDLQKEIKRFASKRTGFRFHEDEPSICLLYTSYAADE